MAITLATLGMGRTGRHLLAHLLNHLLDIASIAENSLQSFHDIGIMADVTKNVLATAEQRVADAGKSQNVSGIFEMVTSLAEKFKPDNSLLVEALRREEAQVDSAKVINELAEVQARPLPPPSLEKP
jgi:predicted transcriptional regulator